MPRFSYSAVDRAGKSVADTLEAPNRKDALRLLSARGLRVSSVSETGTAASAAKRTAAAPDTRVVTLSRKQRLPFLEALRDLVTSGMSAGEAVRLLSVRIKDPGLRLLSTGLWERLSEGSPLSRAMGAYPVVFDASTVSLIQAGEATGSLQDTLERLIAHLNEQRDLRTQLLTALAYPCLLMFVAGGLVLLFFPPAAPAGAVQFAPRRTPALDASPRRRLKLCAPLRRVFRDRDRARRNCVLALAPDGSRP